MLVAEKMDMLGCIILIKAISTLCMRSKRSKSGRYFVMTTGVRVPIRAIWGRRFSFVKIRNQK